MKMKWLLIIPVILILAVGGVSGAGLTFTELFHESFTEPDQNPLNPARWLQVGNSDSPLAVVSNTCRSTGTTTASGEIPIIGTTWPDNQYAAVEVVKNFEEIVSLYVRATQDESSSYEFDIVDNGDGTADVGLLVNSPTIPDGTAILFENSALSWEPGDVFKAAAIDSTILLFQNGKQIVGVEDTTVTSGSPILEISTFDLDAVYLKHFRAGEVTGTPHIKNLAVRRKRG